MKRIIIYIICVLTLTSTAMASSLAQEADSAYTHEDYRLAIRLYQQAIENDGLSPQIYYNLGNAYYRISNLGRAVLCYQRALNLDPSYTDARTNLEFVRTKILDRPEDDSTFLGNMHQHIIGAMSPNAWAWLTFFCFVLLLACAGMYIFSSNVMMRKSGFFGGIIVLFITIYFSIVSWQSASAHDRNNLAVIIVATANMRTEPGSESADSNRVIPMPEGTVVEITDSITLPGESSAPKWYNVKINNSTRAWVNAADVERI